MTQMQKLMEMVKFDYDATLREWKGDFTTERQCERAENCTEGAEIENQRLKPIFELLQKQNEILREALNVVKHSGSEYWVDTETGRPMNMMTQAVQVATAEADRLLEEFIKEHGR
jgi:hypothetical protein